MRALPEERENPGEGVRRLNGARVFDGLLTLRARRALEPLPRAPRADRRPSRQALRRRGAPGAPFRTLAFGTAW
jgi:hypothetical protein